MRPMAALGGVMREEQQQHLVNRQDQQQRFI
jgi:hypothetical protein